MQTKAKIKGKVFKSGNSYAIRIPKALVDTQVLKTDEEYEFDIMAVFLNPVEFPSIEI